MTAGESAGKAAAATPDDRTRSAAADSYNAVEIFVGLGIEDRDPVGERIGEAALGGEQPFGAECARDIAADYAPRTAGVPRELPSALRPPPLVREGGRRDAMAPEAETEASGELA